MECEDSEIIICTILMQVLGLVENMSSFTCPNCGHKTAIFGREGAKRMAEEMGMDTLGDVPLHMSIRETSDNGRPIVVSQPHSPQVSYRLQVFQNLMKDFALFKYVVINHCCMHCIWLLRATDQNFMLASI